MPINISQFAQVFFDEAAEHLAAMEASLLGLDVAAPGDEQLNAIFRAVHSIKGSAGSFGFTDMAETAHILENLLDQLRKHELGLQPEMVSALLEAGDLLRSMIAAHQGRGSVDARTVQAIGERLRQYAQAPSTGAGAAAGRSPASPVAAEAAPAAGTPTAARAFGIEFVPTEAAAHGGRIEHLLDSLSRLGRLEVLNCPDAEDRGVGFWQLRLTALAAPDAVAAEVDAIAERGAWRMTEAAVVDSVGDAPPAGADEAAGEAAANREYGFFTTVDPPPVVSAAAPAAAGAPLAAAEADDSLAAGEEGEDYGFFAPLPAIAPPAATAAPPPMSGAAQRPVAETSIRVSVGKVDQLINLLGELVITQSMLLQTAARMAEAAPEELLGSLNLLERNTRDLQDAVMSIRMLPISFVFARFPRLVHDLSAKLGKTVELKISGESTELDKGLIERIIDPLTHLIRNSLDHGIETPEARRAVGKSPVGTIALKASHQGGHIVIEVSDDGAGLPRDKILAQARQRGLAVDGMSDREVFRLVFEPGFSTAEQVTDLSGRGVGMDVARRNIKELGGAIEMDSLSGIGTRITIRLPLTLAILDGMSVAVGDDIYILPLSSVVESLPTQPGDVRSVAKEGRVIAVHGEFLPVVELRELLAQATPGDWRQNIMVVVAADGRKAALPVDALLGQQQVVIKSLEANYRRVPGISAATIMGDGRVALILDVAAITGMAQSKAEGAADQQQ
ncbi:MAG: chemotaxis protein CheW [Azonexus sp.]|nr:chemotaxis protein CheW [Azonexus sp.]